MTVSETASDRPARSALDGLLQRIRSILQAQSLARDERASRLVQLELARLLALRVDLALYKADAALSDAVDCAVAALQETPPHVEFARELRHKVEDRLSASSAVGRLVFGALVALGLILGVAVVLIVGDYGHRGVMFLGFDIWYLWWYALAGAVGGLVSILLRIPDFAGISSATRTAQFYAGMFRPIVSGTFALLTYFVVSSHLLGMTATLQGAGDSPDDPVRNAFFLAISFVAGFSERLAPGLAARTEQAIGSEGATPPVAK
jgi:hypothetical protein